MTLKQIDDAIFWNELVKAQSRDRDQIRRIDERLLRLMQDRMDIVREQNERSIDRGVREQAAWYDTSAELN